MKLRHFTSFLATSLQAAPSSPEPLYLTQLQQESQATQFVRDHYPESSVALSFNFKDMMFVRLERRNARTSYRDAVFAALSGLFERKGEENNVWQVHVWRRRGQEVTAEGAGKEEGGGRAARLSAAPTLRPALILRKRFW